MSKLDELLQIDDPLVSPEWREFVADAVAELASIRAALVGAHKVIEPFALEAVGWGDVYLDSENIRIGNAGGQWVVNSNITVGDLRAAYQWLKDHPA